MSLTEPDDEDRDTLPPDTEPGTPPRPCPFCGHRAMLLSCDNPDTHFVECLNCFTRGPLADTEEGARCAWDDRS